MATTPSFFWGRSRAETRGGWSLSHGLDKGVVTGGSNHQGVRMRRRLMTQRLMSHGDWVDCELGDAQKTLEHGQAKQLGPNLGTWGRHRLETGRPLGTIRHGQHLRVRYG